MKLSAPPSLTPDLIQTILNEPIPFRTLNGSDSEEQRCQDLLATLNEEEIELAAKGSFAYWVASMSDTKPTSDQQRTAALRECRRHLFKVEFQKAVLQIKDTLKQRKDRNIDCIRTVFMENIETESAEEADLIQKYRSDLTSDIHKQHAFVRGCDKEGHPILILKSRTHAGTVDEEFATAIYYVMDRAAATAETLSCAKVEKIVVVLDFGDFKSSLAPSLSSIKAVAAVLQNNFPERLHKLFILSPPFWMRTMYGMLKPFLDPETRSKFLMATSDDEKMRFISELVEEEQAMPFMLPGGKLQDEVDIDSYMRKVPYNLPYNNTKL